MRILHRRQALLTNYEVYQLLQEQKQARELRRKPQEDVEVGGEEERDKEGGAVVGPNQGVRAMLLPIGKDRLTENVLTIEFEVMDAFSLCFTLICI